MPYARLYALWPDALARYVSDVHAILDGTRSTEWPALFASWQTFRRRAKLGATSTVLHQPSDLQRPLTDVSFHVDERWANLTMDERPTGEDPRIQWLLRQIVLDTARYTFEGRDDKFNAVFCDWLPDQHLFETPEDHEDFEWWRSTLFRNRTPMPLGLEFLDWDLRAYWSPERVKECAAREKRTGFLQTIGGRLGNGGYEAVLRTELLRILAFVELCSVEALAMYYHEQAT